ncbi:MAG: hypothetical protein AAGF74_18010, partial [Pseudomonadota bacterium]
MKKQEICDIRGVAFGRLLRFGVDFRRCAVANDPQAANPINLGGCSRFVLVGKKMLRAGDTMRVLGIDPGLRFLGWGVVDIDGARLRHVGNGV